MDTYRYAADRLPCDVRCATPSPGGLVTYRTRASRFSDGVLARQMRVNHAAIAAQGVHE